MTFKHIILAALFIIIAGLAVVGPSAAESAPCLPEFYYGTATIDGEPIAAGTVITAVISDRVLFSIPCMTRYLT